MRILQPPNNADSSATGTEGGHPGSRNIIAVFQLYVLTAQKQWSILHILMQHYRLFIIHMLTGTVTTDDAILTLL